MGSVRLGELIMGCGESGVDGCSVDVLAVAEGKSFKIKENMRKFRHD